MDADLNARADALTNRLRDPLPFDVDSPSDLDALRNAWAELESTPCVRTTWESAPRYRWPGFDVHTLIDGDNTSGRVSYHHVQLSPGAALPPHYQETASTFIFVIEGEVELTIGSLSEASGCGSVGYAPPLTTQAMRNVGAEITALLVAYLPAGADRAFREAHELWTSTGETSLDAYSTVLQKYGFCFETTGARANDALTNAPVRREEMDIESFDDLVALRHAWLGRIATPKLFHDRSNLAGYRVIEPTESAHVPTWVLVSGDDDRGTAVLREVNVLQTAGPHHQPTEEEAFFVLEGEAELTCGSVTARVGPGAFGFAPRNATHGFSNPEPDVPLRMISMNSPAGHERGFEMMERERARGSSPDRVTALLEAHGWQLHHDPFATD